MSTEVVEEMIATLGLDSSKFTAGQKAAADSMQSFRASVMESSEGMAASLGGVISKFAGLTIGVASLTGLIDLVKNTAFEMKALNIQASILGSNFHTLRTLQEFSQLAGSPPNAGAQFAQSGLSSLYGMLYGGIPQYAALPFWGMPLNAYEEEAKNPKAFYTQLAEGAKARGPSLANPFGLSEQENITQTLMAELHLPEGFANLVGNAAVSDNPAAVIAKQYDAAAVDAKSATQKAADAATKTADALIRLKYQVENQATRFFPELLAATNWTTEAFKELVKILDDVKNSPFAKWVEKMAESAESPAVQHVMSAQQAQKEKNEQSGKNLLTDAWRILKSAPSAFMGGELPSLLPVWLPTPPPQQPGDGRDSLLQTPATSAPGLSWQPDQGWFPPMLPPAQAPLSLSPALGLSSFSMINSQSSADRILTFGDININNPRDASDVANNLATAVARKFQVGQADRGVVS